MNERPKLGSGKSGLNVQLWVLVTNAVRSAKAQFRDLLGAALGGYEITPGTSRTSSFDRNLISAIFFEDPLHEFSGFLAINCYRE